VKYNELNKKSVTELNDILKENKEELFQLKLKMSTMQLEDKHKIRAARRDIARIETKITELSAAEK